MIPDFLAGSYKRYKQDTALFTTWLANAAASSGYKPQATKRPHSEQPAQVKSVNSDSPLPSTPKLKGRERKLARDAAAKAKKQNVDTPKVQLPSTVKYTITTAELLRQAEAVTESRPTSRVQMPAALRAVVERAIQARQRCSEWFQKSQVHNKYADNQHTHFIEILKQSLKILEPCVEEAEPSAKVHGKRAEPSVEGSASISNRFAALNVEDLLDVDPSEVSEVTAAVDVTQKTTISKDGPIVSAYELEDEDDFDKELAFFIFCFFEDLHRTQEFIQELWLKYKARKCDLHTAAITTNAAFDLVRQAEEDLIAQAPDIFDRKRSWDSIAIIIFYADAFERGVCPEARLNSDESLRITPFDDFIYLSTARILMKFTFLADVPKDCKLSYPLPCPPLRFGYISRPELLGTPEMDRKEQQDLTLSRFIIDRQLWNTWREAGKQVGKELPAPPPPDDEFSKALDRLTIEGVLSVALVFEAQIFLDIQDIMSDDVKRGHEDLLRTTDKIDKIMNLKAVNGAWDVGGTGERWHERDVEAVMRIKMTSMYWILDTPVNAFPKLKEYQLATTTSEYNESIDLGSDTSLLHKFPPQQADIPGVPSTEASRDSASKNPKFSTVSMNVHRLPKGIDVRDPEVQRLLRKELVASGQLPDEGPADPKYEETARKMNVKMIQPSKDLNFLFTTNPIYCGLVSFSILTDFEASGISLCNWHKSIWPTAHLYNALQQTSRISKTWPEMEELMDLHMDTLFAGHLPLSAYEYFIRFALALGLSTSNFSRNPRNRNNDRIRFRQGANGTKLKVTEMSSVFRQYFEKESSLEVCLIKLDSLIRNPGARASKKERDAWNRPLTNLQFLAMLEANLPQVTQRLQFDYITLTKQCAKLLKTIRQQLEMKFQVSYPRVPTEDSADQTLTWVVMQILEENNELVAARERDQRGAMAPLVGGQFKVAEEEVEKFLGTYRPRDLISNFNALPRRTRAPSGLVPNHWNISIRHVALSPPGDLVFFVQPDSQFVHSEGPIQTVEGQIPGDKLNLKSLVTLQTIARLIMKSFVEGVSGPSIAAASAPWSWATNDANFAGQIIKVMTDMGVREDLLSMGVADADELVKCDEAWCGLIRELSGSSRP